MVKINREEKKNIEIARKYNIRLGTTKFIIFRMFEEGYKPREVRYLLRDEIVVADDPLIGNIYRYYYDWKKAQ